MSIILQTMCRSDDGKRTFSVRHCHGIYGSVDVGISGGEGWVGAHALDPPPRSALGSDQDTRIVIYVIMTNYM